MKKLTYKEEYEIPIEIVLNNFQVEYAGCGSHKLLIKGEAELEELQNLYYKLINIKGIKLNNPKGNKKKIC